MLAVAGTDDWNNPVRQYTKRSVIEFKNNALFYVTAGSVSTLANSDGYLVPKDTEAVVVSLGRVWTGAKFASKDLHDYLMLPTKTKIVLATINKDDILESAWNAEMYADPHALQKIGISYWMPIIFSSYYTDARMQQYFNYLRTSLTADRGQAWFTPGFKRIGIKTDDLTDAMVAAMPQVVFTTQFLVTDALTKQHLAIVAWYHERYPIDVPFWIVGTVNATYLVNLKNVTGNRRCYFVSGNPHHYAAQGKQLTSIGGGVKSELPKRELVAFNLDVYQRMITEYA
jgi:hypothetical protein